MCLLRVLLTKNHKLIFTGCLITPVKDFQIDNEEVKQINTNLK